MQPSSNRYAFRKTEYLNSCNTEITDIYFIFSKKTYFVIFVEVARKMNNVRKQKMSKQADPNLRAMANRNQAEVNQQKHYSVWGLKNLMLNLLTIILITLRVRSKITSRVFSLFSNPPLVTLGHKIIL